ALEALVPTATPELAALVGALLTTVAERERLERDMDCMNTSSLRLLEQVSMIGETLPRLSAGGDDTEIAALGLRACQRAAGVREVMYLGHLPNKGCCEVLVHFDQNGEGRRPADEQPDLVPAEGLLAEVLALEEGVVLRAVGADGRLGAPGSPEHLAERQVLGVPVAYGAGDKRILLGALLLFDKVESYGQTAAGACLGTEEGNIAESFAAMVGAVLGARKTAALGKELAMAQTIQHQILPDKPVVLRGFDVAARYFACGAVGGDYFDYVPLADGRTMVVVADVSGHNLASGMIMVGARSMLRTLASLLPDCRQIFGALAARMYEDLTRTERFLTAAAVVLQHGAGGVDYVSAGHNDLMVYRAASGSVDRVVSESTILGFVPAPEYAVRRLELQPGDCLLLFTDGITEAMDGNGEMFGEERLAATLAQLAKAPSSQCIVDGLVAELDGFRQGQRGTDDVTAVVIRFDGNDRPAGRARPEVTR
ncbi:MAG: PP2C family protein-serine/threonine phosphatase, partial [Planctomycetota bacterium]